MKPRYFVHATDFDDGTICVKVCSEGYFCKEINGSFHKVCDLSSSLLKDIDDDVKSGDWKEVPIEELVLMFPL